MADNYIFNLKQLVSQPHITHITVSSLFSVGWDRVHQVSLEPACPQAPSPSLISYPSKRSWSFPVSGMWQDREKALNFSSAKKILLIKRNSPLPLSSNYKEFFFKLLEIDHFVFLTEHFPPFLPENGRTSKDFNWKIVSWCSRYLWIFLRGDGVDVKFYLP